MSVDDTPDPPRDLLESNQSRQIRLVHVAAFENTALKVSSNITLSVSDSCFACFNFSRQRSGPPQFVSKYFINRRVMATPWKTSGHPFRHISCQDSRRTSLQPSLCFYAESPRVVQLCRGARLMGSTILVPSRLRASTTVAANSSVTCANRLSLATWAVDHSSQIENPTNEAIGSRDCCPRSTWSLSISRLLPCLCWWRWAVGRSQTTA